MRVPIEERVDYDLEMMEMRDNYEPYCLNSMFRWLKFKKIGIPPSILKELSPDKAFKLLKMFEEFKKK